LSPKFPPRRTDYDSLTVARLIPAPRRMEPNDSNLPPMDQQDNLPNSNIRPRIPGIQYAIPGPITLDQVAPSFFQEPLR